MFSEYGLLQRQHFFRSVRLGFLPAPHKILHLERELQGAAHGESQKMRHANAPTGGAWAKDRNAAPLADDPGSPT